MGGPYSGYEATAGDLAVTDAVADDVLVDTATTIPGTITTLTTNVATVDTVVDGLAVGAVAVVKWTDTDVATDAGYTVGLTATGTPIIIGIWAYGTPGADSTACAIEVTDGGDALISAADGAAANYGSGARVDATTNALGNGGYMLANAETIGFDHTGGGVNTNTMTAVVLYRKTAASDALA